jgi:hypothetical protein
MDFLIVSCVNTTFLLTFLPYPPIPPKEDFEIIQSRLLRLITTKNKADYDSLLKELQYFIERYFKTNTDQPCTNKQTNMV